jgi:hypothetical protein
MNYKIVLDNDILKQYEKYYFNKYPKRRVSPIKSVFPPSLNRFIAMKRMVQNDTKQKYKEFSVWISSFYKIENLKLDKGVTIIYSFYFKDHRRRDVDNTILTPKFFNDGFVDAGVLIDDDGERVRIMFDVFRYDKDNPRIEMNIDDGRIV